MLNPQLQEFGLHLKKLRLARGLSQEQLGLIAELDRTYISGIERGVRNVSLANIFKIAKALDVDSAELFASKR
ncbi:helix-turn-helix transcriptional regulator [Undibacterium sp. RTI2.1]|uniref:helix-turn-helix domain-containing protein n=1 Tax=unclassified Undibacterium TaxID=2630295 RepID=UPI002AB400D1|nr:MULTISPECIES: helix-turn-helix transcriptional regulator [unclassified Undibacterium]MDY7539659.1 helix-turn-helix transcriptional regulator [Undibacterium sp. 5I1]MEB0030677.1 helix-turn-helix transcriptional regulator [Undibacterium sp. RTI2.1]MEB0117204.1 helix-turn-helix transcriptional regulator [Undibacterium sp. RTI2.2]MEB0232238.1 helix-turn-helix transcriptional regulator [Undibacterium sp. 10I3]MEB0257435.1 helix-turn-helix transcriptional regulator [Undibacterium sp. 5I1]